MPLGDLIGFAALVETLACELGDRLQQLVARVAELVPTRLDEAVLDEDGERRQEVGATNALGGGQVAATAEDRQATEERLVGLLEQVEAPLNRVAKCLLSRRQVAWPAGQQAEAVVHALEHRLRRKQAAARGGELDRQRQTVEPAADLADRPAVVLGEREVVSRLLRALCEELNGRRAHDVAEARIYLR